MKTVVMRVSFDVLYEVPDDFDDGSVEYSADNHCKDNVIKRLADGLADSVCRTCFRSKTEVLREATDEDLGRLAYAPPLEDEA